MKGEKEHFSDDWFDLSNLLSYFSFYFSEKLSFTWLQYFFILI